jgi:hypothetical protein
LFPPERHAPAAGGDQVRIRLLCKPIARQQTATGSCQGSAGILEVPAGLRRMFDEFPKNHNIILFGQTDLLAKMSLNVNTDIKSRITFSTILLRLNPDDMEAFIYTQLDKAGLGHNIFSPDAVTFIPSTRSGQAYAPQTAICVDAGTSASPALSKPSERVPKPLPSISSTKSSSSPTGETITTWRPHEPTYT